MKKLNLGCGGDYKQGYLNVDAYDTTVADKKMQAYNLQLEDDTFDEILMSQLIEHLGIVGSIHCLSECFRVLKPEGKLIIETPDIKKSFEIFLNDGREDRKNILPWIYGVDISGMVHRFCYPDDLLEETLKQIGFKEFEKNYFFIDQYEPVLKVICKKPKDDHVYQLMTHFRKKLLEHGIIDLEDQITSLEKHDLVDLFTNEINKYREKKDIIDLHKIICSGAIVNPKITLKLLEILKLESNIPTDFFNKYYSVLNILEDIDFPNILLTSMMKIEGYVGEQNKLYIALDELALATVQNLLQNEDNEKIIQNLRDTFKSIQTEDKIEYLSDKMIKLKSNRFFQIGIKEFSLNNYEEAVNMFSKSIALFRDQIFAYWNLGRLLGLQGKINESKSFYEEALEVLSIIDFEHKDDIKKQLESEIKDQNIEKYSQPILSVKELF
jgi:tetratricopeptide (TPR) repeat protein